MRVRIQQPKPQKIEMMSRRFGYFPRTFRVGAVTHTVTRVDRCWTTSTRSHPLAHHYFAVTCEDGAYTVYQDIKTGEWYLSGKALT